MTYKKQYRNWILSDLYIVGSASAEGGDEELEDGINLNVTARVSPIE